MVSTSPLALVSASAVGYYGDRGDETLTEQAPPGSDFLAQVSVEWEAATEPAAQAGIRVAHSRFGIVLSPQGGALKAMLLPFKMGVGGNLGSGMQWTSWTTLHWPSMWLKKAGSRRKTSSIPNPWRQ